MNNNHKKYPVKILMWSLLMVLSAIWAAIDNFSLVPFAGSWEGGLGFYLKVISGDTSVWFTNVLDHIFIIGELLTWIDFKFFGGVAISIVTLTYFLFFSSAIIFCLFLKELIYTSKSKAEYLSLSAIVFAWIFLYMQAENMLNGWSFHNVAINFISILTFFLLYKNETDPNSIIYKLAIIFLSLLASLTTISGVLLAPIIFLYLLFFSKDRKWSLVFIALILLSFYFYIKFGSEVVGKNSSRVALILHQPLDYLKFLFTYIGNPFWHLIHLNKVGKNIAFIMGVIFLVLSTRAFVQEIHKKNLSQLNLSLLFFIIFSVCFACSVTYGRFENGIDQALVGRYSTQAIFSWAALFVLYSPFIIKRMKESNYIFYVLSFFLIFFMSLNQTKALRFHNEISNINLAGLAITMGVYDKNLIENSVWHPVSDVIEISRKGKNNNVGYVNFYPYSEVDKSIDLPKKFTSCQIAFDENYLVENDNRYYYISGALRINTDINKAPSKILYLLDKPGKNIIGYVLTRKKHIFNNHYNFFFKGYYKNLGDKGFTIATRNEICSNELVQ